MWFRKHQVFEKCKNPYEDEGSQNSPQMRLKNLEKTSVIKKEYLMSKQEMRQEEIIESIFKNFDTDGSGSLTNDEMV